jgi:hypothetical protein
MPYTAGTKFSVENPYVLNNIEPIYPAWTYLRQAQDNIVDEEESSNGTAGNQAPATSSSSASDKKSITDSAKDLWNKFTNLFK